MKLQKGGLTLKNLRKNGAILHPGAANKNINK